MKRITVGMGMMLREKKPPESIPDTTTAYEDATIPRTIAQGEERVFLESIDSEHMEGILPM